MPIIAPSCSPGRNVRGSWRAIASKWGCQRRHPRLSSSSVTTSPRPQRLRIKDTPRTPHSRSPRRESPCSNDRRPRSEEHTSELQSLAYLVCRLLLEKKKHTNESHITCSDNCIQ